jgi:hypothetical protein
MSQLAQKNAIREMGYPARLKGKPSLYVSVTPQTSRNNTLADFVAKTNGEKPHPAVLSGCRLLM